MPIINNAILLEDLREETVQGKCPCTLHAQYTHKWDDLDCPIKIVNFKYNDIRYNAQFAILDFTTKMHPDAYKKEDLHQVFRLYLFRSPYHIPGKEKIVNACNMGPPLTDRGLWEHIYVKECWYEMIPSMRNENGSEAYHPTKLWGLSCSMNENDRVAKIGVCRYLNIENDNCDLKGLTSDASIEPEE